ncbi:MAG: hypothetical protein A2W93_04205 [Bacteroidetes bacterium GWF2_43_63]|nr:MAG: hypothetical protein A2W94_06005 [Bacteroidetes bacterium GWE2_42_42]OFY54385.1 MAG: hypothetical protein A2W93_04205 [Bacteroidetes bacterium GWF2_43_63]HBG69225.1 hypothetical protein [Bacteroidales bacterium]HCB61220.1 hypothetical protein [Bacteroidales bacterium]HCY24139.1 hypothetical protein [Bacteroidales bacterium]
MINSCLKQLIYLLENRKITDYFLWVFIAFTLILYSCNSQNSNAEKSAFNGIDRLDNCFNPISGDTIIKIDNIMFKASKLMKYEILKHGEKSKFYKHGDTVFEDPKKIIVANYEAIATPGVFVKFSFKNDFCDFDVAEIYSGKLAMPDFSTDRSALKFVTRIKNGCEDEGVNFAGHYTIVTWGCGSSCQQMAIVDRITGKIIYSQLPFMNNYSGSEFRKDSRMLIINAESLSENWGFEEGFIRVNPYTDPSVFVISENTVMRIE